MSSCKSSFNILSKHTSENYNTAQIINQNCSGTLKTVSLDLGLNSMSLRSSYVMFYFKDTCCIIILRKDFIPMIHTSNQAPTSNLDLKSASVTMMSRRFWRPWTVPMLGSDVKIFMKILNSSPVTSSNTYASQTPHVPHKHVKQCF